MGNPILARVKRMRKVKAFNLFWQSFVSRNYSQIRKCYPDAEALLAVVYPPAYLIHRHRKRFSRVNFKMAHDFPRKFGLHGLFGSPLFKMQRKLMLKRLSRRRQQPPPDVTPHLTPLSRRLQRRVVQSMPYLTSTKSLELMAHEREKHEPEIDFLNVDTYPEFTVRMFEKYKFNKLISFVVAELSRNQTPVWEFFYFKEKWIGIRLADLRTISEKYPPISKVGGKSKLTFRLIPSKMAQDQFFLYELHAGVTKNGRLTRVGRPFSVFKKVRPFPTPESIVLLCNPLEY